MLARGHLVVVLVHLHADPLHRRQHLGAQILRLVHGGHREVAALDAGTVAHVAHLVFGAGVPGAVDGIDRIADLFHADLVADVIEDEELGLGAPVGHVADARGLQIGLGLLRGAARVAVVGFVGVRLDDGAVKAQRLLGVERVDIGRAHVGQQLHVRLVDGLPPGDRRAVEHEAFVQEVLVDDVYNRGDVLQFAARVGEAQIDILDLFILHLRKHGGNVTHVSFPELLVRLLWMDLERVGAFFAGTDPDRLADV